MKGTEALIFFYGIFWAAMIGTTSRYQPFDTASTWRGIRFAKKRFYVSVFILNILPILGFITLYMFIVPPIEGLLSNISAAIGSISVFGYIRILHAFIASDNFFHSYYTMEEIEQVRDKGVFSQPQSFSSHFFPGLIYIIFCYVVSFLITKIPMK